MISESILTLVFKGMAFVAVGVYVFFAMIVVRQVYLMTQTLKVGFEGPIRLVVWVHFFVSFAILLMTFLSFFTG